MNHGAKIVQLGVPDRQGRLMPALTTPQTASSVLMIRPTQFGFNEQTAASNTYQRPPQDPAHAVRTQALSEFDALHARLVQAGVRVVTFEDLPCPHTPDAVFPNNWFSLHPDGTLVLYPMAAQNRRLERRPHLLTALQRDLGGRRLLDLTHFEAAEKYLEGTGSLVLDHVHRVAYAALSPRTHPEVVEAYCAALDYRAVLFTTTTRRGQPAYHTNVVLSVGESAAVVCLEAIAEASQRAAVESSLRASGRTLLLITAEQMDRFAANLLELRAQDGTRLWVLSSQAHAALSPAQRQQLAYGSRIVHSPLPTIESVGGGSARCMLAELFAEPS